MSALLKSPTLAVLSTVVMLTLALQRAAHGESATVSGKVSCAGSSVGISIDIDGELTAATAESIRKLFDDFHEKEKKTKSGFQCDDSATKETLPDLSAFGTHFEISSRGGSINAAMAIGRMFRNEAVSIGVNGVCFSACVLVLAGAVDRHVGSSKIGIHRPYLGTTPNTPFDVDRLTEAYKRVLQDMRSYLREMNVSQRLADDMLAVEPESNRILTTEELKGYRLTGVDPAEQQKRAVAREVSDIEEAKQLNLDRREYTRRKSIGATLCLFTMSGEVVTDHLEYSNCQKRVLATGQR
ncbi:hypothetical protein HNQ36_000952 [Afipia massiliensis]|uniref:Uncharacterized protein n=1 Tax=Afipia massiliensis TaxID=211460 RepID=A0A840MZ49_9BRAD|nr:ATP-dependent Clp protease proteolytic subunit [Afipia massiliensis]MBB5050998.1 hypothetical protein [Afipia massiliensis]